MVGSNSTIPTLDPDGVVLARFARPRIDDSTRIGVLSDIHVATRERGTHRLFHLTQGHFETALDRFEEADLDFVVFAGDLTKDGEPWNFERVDELLEGFGTPFLATPGNHDVPKSFDDHPSVPAERFYERYTPRGLPTVERVGGVELLVIDSATAPDGSLFDSHRGAIPLAQREWLETELADASAPIVVGHHNVLPLVRGPLADAPSWRTSTMHDWPDVADGLAAAGASLVVSGHHHVPAVIERGSLRQVIAPAACAYPQGHLVIEVGPAGTTVRMEPHADPATQRTAYDALQANRFRRTVSGIVADAIEAAPLVDRRAERRTPLG